MLITSISRFVNCSFVRLAEFEDFCGPCATVDTAENHRPVLAALEKEGNGRVLVVDGHGSLRVGVLGDRIAAKAVANGWIGVVIVGAIRDSHGIDQLNIGVKALGVTARRSFAELKGSEGGVLGFGSVIVEPEQWVYADRDCVLVSREKRDVRQFIAKSDLQREAG